MVEPLYDGGSIEVIQTNLLNMDSSLVSKETQKQSKGIAVRADRIDADLPCCGQVDRL
jgi:hypothetical protein